MTTVCVVGVGLIGGSLGLALRKNKPKKYVVTGWGRHVQKLAVARRIGAIDRFETDAAGAVGSADIVVLCVPVHRIVPQLENISRWLKPGAIVTDVGSVKKASSTARGARCAAGRTCVSSARTPSPAPKKPALKTPAPNFFRTPPVSSQPMGLISPMPWPK
jgi:prephenate dehydrogenase